MEIRTKPKIEWLTLGRIRGAHGVKGMLRVESYTEPTDNLLHYSPLYIRLSDRIERLFIEHGKLLRHNKTLLVSVTGCNARDQALQFKDAIIIVDQAKLPVLESQQFYWSQLIGLTVMTMEGQELGTIKTLLPTGAHDVLVVQGKTEHLIPYIPNSVILNVDLHNKTLLAHWDNHF